MVQPRAGFPPTRASGKAAGRSRRSSASCARSSRRPTASAPGHLHVEPHGLHVVITGGGHPRLASKQGVRARGSFDLGISGLRGVYDSTDTGAIKADSCGKTRDARSRFVEHIDHAATDDAEMRAYGHRGYEGVAADRSAVLEAWTSPKVKDVITARHQLTNYRELAKR